MKHSFPVFLLSILFLLQPLQHYAQPAQEHKILAIGAPAPDFSLPAVDGRIYTLASFSNNKILVVIFTCNHCPTAQAYEDRIIKLTSDYSGKGVAVVAVMPNDPRSITLNELDYTDLSDSFGEMKIRATEKRFNFPYLYDGDTQATAKAYGPAVTPHVFIFDEKRRLRFRGRIDDVENPAKTPKHFDTRNAIEALLANKELVTPTTKVFGCSTKWKEKSDWIVKAQQEWAKEPVHLNDIDTAGIKNLLRNDSDKLRLINIWATWCGPCITEFPEFVTINRMYRKRDFEFISISADDPAKKERALQFLQKQQASNVNYIFSGDDKYQLIEAVDPNWQGALPYTILVEPGGKIVYARQGIIDPLQMKKTIIEHPLLGRYY
ncbi:redoxin family protein [Agriterribacter sp.]|uniref:redoxin family protein n=1 Tax=Agriterribacter sp. TaxID=2821509 RepID=UPI002D074BDF|nr:redoxin family protein [Agriterribacter sp.]HRP57254.1 redoxin family protein [Agriterribacter sp.]